MFFKLSCACVCLVVAAALGGCEGSKPTDLDGGIPAALLIVSGDEQSGPVDTELPDPLVVSVVDTDGAPVRDQIVNFVVVKGGGRVFAGANQTNADGIAQERWTLGKSVTDSQVVEVRAVDPSTGAPLVFGRFVARTTAGPPSALDVLSGSGQSTAVGMAFSDSVRVQVRDAFGNPVPAIVVTFAIESGTGSLSASTVTTSDNGTAAVQWTAGTALGSASVLVSAAGLESRLVQSTIIAGPPVAIEIVSGANTIVTVGTEHEIVVRFVDTHGNGVEGARIIDYHAVSSGYIVDSDRTTLADGLARVRWQVGTTVGQRSLKVRLAREDGSVIVPAVTIEVSTVPAHIASFVKIEGDSQYVLPGTSIPIRPAFRATDPYGNAVPGQPVTFRVLNGGGSITGANAVTDADGVVRLHSWTVGPVKDLNKVEMSADNTGTTWIRTVYAFGGSRTLGLRMATINWMQFPDQAVFIPDSGRFDVIMGSPLPSVSSVVMSVGGQMFGLTQSSMDPAYWSGVFDLSALSLDSMTLIATATRSDGAQTDTYGRVIHDQLPDLVWQMPDTIVASPTVRLQAGCEDETPGCELSLIRVITNDIENTGPLLYSGATLSVDQVVSLEGAGLATDYPYPVRVLIRDARSRLTREIWKHLIFRP